jgi:hypothetical protein
MLLRSTLSDFSKESGESLPFGVNDQHHNTLLFWGF